MATTNWNLPCRNYPSRKRRYRLLTVGNQLVSRWVLKKSSRRRKYSHGSRSSLTVCGTLTSFWFQDIRLYRLARKGRNNGLHCDVHCNEPARESTSSRETFSDFLNFSNFSFVKRRFISKIRADRSCEFTSKPNQRQFSSNQNFLSDKG